jgi:hypothetical protein
VREELESVGINEALFEGCIQDESCQEAIKKIEAEPWTRQELHMWMKEIKSTIMNDAMIKDLEMDANRQEGDDHET